MIHRYRRCLAALIALGAFPLLEAAASPAATASAPAGCAPLTRFESDDFPRGAQVDNKWFPLTPGTNFVMKGTVVEDGVVHRHRIVTTVTDLTKVINGVRSIVVFERDYDDGRLQESELAFMAQDKDGRVWNVGEYPEEYADGQFEGAPSTWIAGIAGARAGVGMRAVPRLGSSAYLQGLARKVGFYDCAKVLKTGQRVCVPVHCYDNVLVIDEWAPPEPEGGHQRKYYAPGIGNIRVDAVGGVAREVLELAQLTKLSPKALTAVRSEALAQDRRGYRVSPKVYGRTPPAKRTLSPY